MTIEKIERRLDDAIKNGTEADVNYWRGYRDAVKAMLKEEPNEPLTLEELRRMGGKPVWCEELQCWGIVKYETVGAWKNKPFLAGVWQNPDFETAVSFEYDIKSRGLTLYRRPPKEDKPNEV